MTADPGDHLRIRLLCYMTFAYKMRPSYLVPTLVSTPLQTPVLSTSIAISSPYAHVVDRSFDRDHTTTTMLLSCILRAKRRRPFGWRLTPYHISRLSGSLKIVSALPLSDLLRSEHGSMDGFAATARVLERSFQRARNLPYPCAILPPSFPRKSLGRSYQLQPSRAPTWSDGLSSKRNVLIA